ncbi:unnamed protein product [Brassica oleracea]
MIRFIVLHFISFVKDIASFTRLPCNETNAVAELRHQTFTISRIFPVQELAPIPTLEEGADVTEPALLQNVAAEPEGIAAITSSVAAPSPEADGTFSQREEVAAEEADLAGNASKKARVE